MEKLFHWNYLIFLVPFLLSAFLLLLSSLRLGHGHGHAAHAHSGAHRLSVPCGTHAAQHAAVSHGAAHHTPHGAAPHGAHGNAGHSSRQDAGRNGRSSAETSGFLHILLGSRPAPLIMVVEAFFLVWGLLGSLANQWLLAGISNPTLAQFLPCMGIAFGGGLVGARAASELISRMMPEDETLIVSREGLYGLKGKVVFPVTESGGRIHVYDDFGSLHDETCRVAAGCPVIERGSKAIVMDRDAAGHLIVEEIAE